MTTTPIVGNEVIFSADPLAEDPRVTALADDTFTLAWDTVDGRLFAKHLDETGNFTTGNFLTNLSFFGDPLNTPLVVQETSGEIKTELSVIQTSGLQAPGEHNVDQNFTPTPFIDVPEVSAGTENLIDAVPTFQGVAISYETRDSSSNTHTFIRFIGPDGNPLFPDTQVGAVGESGSQFNAILLSTGLDIVAVAYTHLEPTTGERDIRFQFIANGIKGSPVVVSGGSALPDFADMTRLADGSTIIVSQNSPDGIFFRRLLPNGETDGFGMAGAVSRAFCPKSRL